MSPIELAIALAYTGVPLESSFRRRPLAPETVSETLPNVELLLTLPVVYTLPSEATRTVPTYASFGISVDHIVLPSDAASFAT